MMVLKIAFGKSSHLQYSKGPPRAYQKVPLCKLPSERKALAQISVLIRMQFLRLRQID